MGSKTQCNLRIENELLDILKEISKDYNITITDLVKDSLYNYLPVFKQLKNNIVLVDLKKKQALKKAKSQMTEYLALVYIIRNFYRNIFYLTQSFLLNNNEVNMDVINHAIDEVLNMFQYYPDQLREQLNPDIKALLELRKKDYLMAKYNIFAVPLMRKADEISFISQEADKLIEKYGGNKK